MNQHFSNIQLKKLCKESEIEEYGYSANDFESFLDETCASILDGNFEFKVQKYNEFYLVNDLCQKLVLRKLNDNIKRIYKDEQSNRRIIISQVKSLLEETTQSWILKADIKSFYESVNRARLIEKMQEDTLLSYHSIYLINKLFDHPFFKGQTGLPRGMNLSATLSEIYMRKFDNWIRTFKGIFYYARFVDDMIIFTNSSESVENLASEMNKKLNEFTKGLVLNSDKTQTYRSALISENKPLEYLGYKFVKNCQKIPNPLKISIAEKKVKKIKTRIIRALLDYTENFDFVLLSNRMRFLTGNYSIRRRKDGRDLRAGLYYNYLEVNDLTVFDELNLFYLKAINSKNNSFGAKMSVYLTKEQIKSLSKFSFKHGFIKRVYYSLTFEETKKIISCW